MRLAPSSLVLVLAAMLTSCASDEPSTSGPTAAGVNLLPLPSWVAVGETSTVRADGPGCAITWQVAQSPPGSSPRLVPGDRQLQVTPDAPGDYVIEGAACGGQTTATVHAFTTTLKIEDTAPVTLPVEAYDVAGDASRVALVSAGVEVFALPGATSLGRTPEAAPLLFGAELSDGWLATATFSCPTCAPCCANGSCEKRGRCSGCCPVGVEGGAHVYSLVDGVKLVSTPVIDDAFEVAFQQGRLAATTTVGLVELVDLSDPAAPVPLGCVREKGTDPDLNVAFDGARVVTLSQRSVRLWGESQFAPDCLDSTPVATLPRLEPVDDPFGVPSLAVSERLALAGGRTGLEIFDLSSRPPRRVASFPDLPVVSIAAAGGFALVGHPDRTWAVDLRDRAHPVVAAVSPVSGRPVGLGPLLAVTVQVKHGDTAVTELHSLTISPLP